jgi:hypothetical protein
MSTPGIFIRISMRSIKAGGQLKKMGWVCVVCILCLIVVPLPPGENPFAVKINNNNNSILEILPKLFCVKTSMCV